MAQPPLIRNPEVEELVAGPGLWRPHFPSASSQQQQRLLDEERERTHWEEVDFVVRSFLPSTKRNLVVGRNALDLCRCARVLEMSAIDLDLLQASLRSEGLPEMVTHGDLVDKARLYWQDKGEDPDKVLAVATTRRGDSGVDGIAAAMPDLARSPLI